MKLRAFHLIGLGIAGCLLSFVVQAAGVLTVELTADRRAPRGWPLHFQWNSFSEVPVEGTLVLQGFGGVELNVTAVSTGHWWLSAEQTQALPPGPATARVGPAQVQLEFVDLAPPLSTGRQDEKRFADIRYALDTGQAAQARALAESWVALSPDTPTPRVLLGDALEALTLLPEALAAYKGALERTTWSTRPPESLLERINSVRYQLFDQLPRQAVVPEDPEPQTLEEQDRVYGSDPKGQWALTATASSEYRTTGDYSASRATGAPDVIRYGDSLKAWASRLADSGEEWLELTFSNAVKAAAVRVRQVYNPGAITQVEVFDAAGAGTTVYQDVDTNVYPANQIAWFIAKFPRTVQPVQRLRLTLDSARVKGWNELDAVQLVAGPEIPPLTPTLSYAFETRTGIMQIVSWPDGFMLQRATKLSPADWQPYADKPPASIPFGEASSFFQLIQAP